MTKASDSDASIVGARSPYHRIRSSTRVNSQGIPLVPTRGAHVPPGDSDHYDDEASSETLIQARPRGQHGPTHALHHMDVDSEDTSFIQGKRRTRGSSRTRSVPATSRPSPAPTSIIRPLLECALFVTAWMVVLGRLLQSAPDVRDKAFEMLVVGMVLLVCFFLHLQHACTIWVTRVTYLRKADPSDPLYVFLLPLVACAQLLDVAPTTQPPGPLAPPRMGLGMKGAWRVERLPEQTDPVQGRSTLLDLHVLCALILGIHICVSSCVRAYCKRRAHHWKSLPPGKSFLIFHAFALILSSVCMSVQIVCRATGHAHWLLASMPTWMTFTTALLFQNQLYMVTRVAHQNCTLGELSIICAVGTALFHEAVIVTMARLMPPYAKYFFREPSAIMYCQLALIVGMFLIGYVLSPLLVLSRNLAQRPTHRLRWPLKRNLHRRLLALAFFVFSLALVLGVLAPWLGWQLRKRSAWFYLARFMLQGPYWWFRFALLAYWGALCNIALLSIQLMVNRMWQYATVGDQVKKQPRYQPNSGSGTSNASGVASGISSVGSSAIGGSGAGAGSSNGRVSQMSMHGRTALTATERASTLAATQFSERGEQEESTSLGPRVAVSVNGRRKFFHALAVLLFVPGIAWDPAFMHLAFSGALAVFVLCEYLRYCAVYPVGATLHFFLSQFLDSKDSGLVILSHGYLLSGCAAGLWVESQSRITQQLGVLALGVGDAVASIVGRQYGRIHWPLSNKTVEGTFGFVASMITSVTFLRIFGLVEAFRMVPFTVVMVLLAMIEGLSEQNDNIVLPLSGIFLTSMIPLGSS